MDAGVSGREALRERFLAAAEEFRNVRCRIRHGSGDALGPASAGDPTAYYTWQGSEWQQAPVWELQWYVEGGMPDARPEPGDFNMHYELRDRPWKPIKQRLDDLTAEAVALTRWGELDGLLANAPSLATSTAVIPDRHSPLEFWFFSLFRVAWSHPRGSTLFADRAYLRAAPPEAPLSPYERRTDARGYHNAYSVHAHLVKEKCDRLASPESYQSEIGNWQRPTNAFAASAELLRLINTKSGRRLEHVSGPSRERPEIGESHGLTNTKSASGRPSSSDEVGVRLEPLGSEITLSTPTTEADPDKSASDRYEVSKAAIEAIERATRASEESRLADSSGFTRAVLERQKWTKHVAEMNRVGELQRPSQLDSHHGFATFPPLGQALTMPETIDLSRSPAAQRDRLAKRSAEALAAFMKGQADAMRADAESRNASLLEKIELRAELADIKAALADLVNHPTMQSPSGELDPSPSDGFLREPPQPEGEKPPAHAKGKNINGRMLTALSDAKSDPEKFAKLLDRTQRRWATALDCSAGTVGGTGAWQDILVMRATQQAARVDGS